MIAVRIFQFRFDYPGEFVIQLRGGFDIKPVGCNLFVGTLRFVSLPGWACGGTTVSLWIRALERFRCQESS